MTEGWMIYFTVYRYIISYVRILGIPRLGIICRLGISFQEKKFEICILSQGLIFFFFFCQDMLSFRLGWYFKRQTCQKIWSFFILFQMPWCTPQMYIKKKKACRRNSIRGCFLNTPTNTRTRKKKTLLLYTIRGHRSLFFSISKIQQLQ